MAKACLKSKSFSLRDRQYRAVIRQFIWLLKPDYMITVNPNYGDSDKRKYRQQRPLDTWLKNLDAVLNSRLIQRRVSKLAPGSRVSFLAFPEFTKDGCLHFHILLALPSQTYFTNAALSARQVQYRVRRIIKQALQKFFRGSSVMVKAIWSKGAVDYTTKCFHRSTEIDWTYWRKQPETHDAMRLNTGAEFPAGDHDANANNSIPRLRHPVEGSPCLAPVTGTAESATEVGRRQAIAANNPTSPVAVVEHSRNSNSTRHINFRGYSYRTFIARIAATAREWFRMRVADG